MIYIRNRGPLYKYIKWFILEIEDLCINILNDLY